MDRDIKCKVQVTVSIKEQLSEMQITESEFNVTTIIVNFISVNVKYHDYFYSFQAQYVCVRNSTHISSIPGTNNLFE